MSRHRCACAVRIILALGLLACASGCESVPSYKHGKLSHPTMKTEEMNIGLDGHVRAVSEGATGGLSGAGGGCGCN